MPMLERYAALSDQLQRIEADRGVAIGDANAIADGLAEPVLGELDVIRAKLEPWWAKAGAGLLQKDRKSTELGGCMIGTKKGADSLGVPEDAKPVVEALKKLRWAKPLLRVTTSLDKGAVLKSIDGIYAEQLKALGLKRVTGADAFFVKRAEQQGVRA
jgi:phage host-nuclease inhibitor protein Gam